MIEEKHLLIDLLLIGGVAIPMAVKMISCLNEYRRRVNQYYELDSPGSVMEVNQIPLLKELTGSSNQKRNDFKILYKQEIIDERHKCADFRFRIWTIMRDRVY